MKLEHMHGGPDPRDSRYPSTLVDDVLPTPGLPIVHRRWGSDDAPEETGPGTLTVAEVTTTAPDCGRVAFRVTGQVGDDGGGCILTFSVMNAGPESILPVSKPHDSGIALHIGGDHEARAFLLSLRLAIEVMLCRGDQR